MYFIIPVILLISFRNPGIFHKKVGSDGLIPKVLSAGFGSWYYTINLTSNLHLLKEFIISMGNPRIKQETVYSSNKVL